MDDRFAELMTRIHHYANDGAMVLVKIDGQRVLAGNPAIYTVVVSGGKLAKHDFYHRDGVDLVELVQGALDYYQSAPQRSPS